jgi:hypothetical protein
MFMPTDGTLATCSSFGASEALDAGLFRFVGEIVNITPILPEAHPLVMVASMVLVSHPVGIANEEGPDFLLKAKIDDFACGLMALVANTALCSSCLLVFGVLQFLPTPGMLCAASLFFADRPQGFRSLPFQRTNPPSGDNESFTGIGGHTGKMDFP